MSTYKNPTAPTIAVPYNIDAEIQRLQLGLAAGLPWLAKSFGRAETARKTLNDRVIVYPEVYTGEAGKPYQDVSPNNKLKSQSFFKIKDPIEFAEDAIDGSSFIINASSIFWFDLDKIAKDDPAYDLGYRFTALLLKEVRAVLDSLGVSIQSVYLEVEEVFSGYTIDHVEHQTFKQPFSGFRIDFVTSTIETC